MSVKIRHLIDIWASHPPRVEADDPEHQLYVFHALLPALRDAMPDIITSQTAGLVAGSPLPNSVSSLGPSPEPSSHSPTEIPNTVGSDEASGHTEGIYYTPASLSANVEPPAENWRETIGRAKPKSAKKRVAAPPSEGRGIA